MFYFNNKSYNFSQANEYFFASVLCACLDMPIGSTSDKVLDALCTGQYKKISHVFHPDTNREENSLGRQIITKTLEDINVFMLLPPEVINKSIEKDYLIREASSFSNLLKDNGMNAIHISYDMRAFLYEAARLFKHTSERTRVAQARQATKAKCSPEDRKKHVEEKLERARRDELARKNRELGLHRRASNRKKM